MYSYAHWISDKQIASGLQLALEQAKAAKQQNTYPIGAIITDFDGNVIAQAHNMVVPKQDPTAHAEIEVIRKAGKYLRESKYQSVLYTTIEPCLMCMGAIIASDISIVVWGVNDLYGGAAEFVLNEYTKENARKPDVISEPDSDIAVEIRELMREWEQGRGYSDENWV